MCMEKKLTVYSVPPPPARKKKLKKRKMPPNGKYSPGNKFMVNTCKVRGKKFG